MFVCSCSVLLLPAAPVPPHAGRSGGQGSPRPHNQAAMSQRKLISRATAAAERTRAGSRRRQVETREGRAAQNTHTAQGISCAGWLAGSRNSSLSFSPSRDGDDGGDDRCRHRLARSACSDARRGGPSRRPMRAARWSLPPSLPLRRRLADTEPGRPACGLL